MKSLVEELEEHRRRRDMRMREKKKSELGIIKKTRNTLDCKTAARSNILIALSSKNTGMCELGPTSGVERKV